MTTGFGYDVKMKTEKKCYRFYEKNKLYVALIVAVLMLSLCFLGACTPSRGVKNSREIVDSVGRTVSIPKDPQVIATLDPLAGASVIMLGCGDKMVATTSGVQRDLLLQAICPALTDAAVVKAEGTMNAETILQLKVDLMFVKSEMYNSKTEKDKLNSLNIPYLVIDYANIDQQQAAVKLIGDALNATEEADAYIKYYREKLELIENVIKDIPQEKHPTLYHATNEALRTDFPGSLGADWIRRTGVINVSLGKEENFDKNTYYTTLEQIYVWQPEYIICNESGVADYIMSSKKWAELRAVKNNKVLQVPIGASRWGHDNSIETILAMQWLVKAVYPEQFDKLDLKAETKSFYKTFFDYEIDDETYQMIISGEGLRPAAPSSKNK